MSISFSVINASNFQMYYITYAFVFCSLFKRSRYKPSGGNNVVKQLRYTHVQGKMRCNIQILTGAEGNIKKIMPCSCSMLPEGQRLFIFRPSNTMQPGNIVYFCTSCDACWTNHDRVI